MAGQTPLGARPNRGAGRRTAAACGPHGPRPLKKKASKATKAKEQIEKNQLGEVASAEQLNINRSEADLEWSADTSSDAVKKRQLKALGDKLKDLALVDDQTGDELKKFLQDKHTTKQIVDFVTKLQKREAFSNDRRVVLLFDAFFDKNILKQIKDAAPVIKHFCSTKRLQAIVLGRLEILLAANEPLIKSLNDILNSFYEYEVLSEEALIDWFDVPTAKYVTAEVLAKIHKSAKPFIEWLKNADEDDDDEDDDEEDGKKGEVKAEVKVEAKKVEKKVEPADDDDSDDEEVDLDDL